MANDYLRITDSAVIVGGAYAGPHSVLVSGDSGWGTNLVQETADTLSVTTATAGTAGYSISCIGSIAVTSTTTATVTLDVSGIGGVTITTSIVGEESITRPLEGSLATVIETIGTLGKQEIEAADIHYITTLIGTLTSAMPVSGAIDIVTIVDNNSFWYRKAVWLLRAEPVLSTSRVAVHPSGNLRYSSGLISGSSVAVKTRTSGLLQNSRYLIPKELITSTGPCLVIDSVKPTEILQVQTDFNPL